MEQFLNSLQSVFTEYAVYFIIFLIGFVGYKCRGLVTKQLEILDAKIQKELKEQTLVDVETAAKLYESAKEMARGLYWVVEKKFEDIINVSSEKKSDLISRLTSIEMFSALTEDQLDSIVEAICAEVKATETSVGLTTQTTTTTINDESTGTTTTVATTKAVTDDTTSTSTTSVDTSVSTDSTSDVDEETYTIE